MMKKLILSAVALTLSACGFTPMHSASNIVGESGGFKTVTIEMDDPAAVSDKEASYYVEQSLRDRMSGDAGHHTLKLSTKSRRRPYGLTSSDVASRYDMTITVNYELVDNVSGDVLDKGKVSAITTFGSSRDPYARISAQKSATEQVSRDAADQLIVRMASYYKDPERRERERAERKAKRKAEKMAAEGIETLETDNPNP